MTRLSRLCERLSRVGVSSGRALDARSGSAHYGPDSRSIPPLRPQMPVRQSSGSGTAHRPQLRGAVARNGAAQENRNRWSCVHCNSSMPGSHRTLTNRKALRIGSWCAIVGEGTRLWGNTGIVGRRGAPQPPTINRHTSAGDRVALSTWRGPNGRPARTDMWGNNAQDGAIDESTSRASGLRLHCTAA